MQVRLLETAHETWAPKGTIGEVWLDGGTDIFTPKKFMPNEPSEDFPWPDGMYLGATKFERVTE